MTLIDKITFKFKNLLRFEKLNPVDNFEMAEDFEGDYHINYIDLFRNLISQHYELKEIIWVAIYHCLNTFDSSIEFLTVLDVNFEIIADLIEGDDEHVIIPEIIKKEILDGNVLATFHNHFQGAVIPSSKDFENTILPLIQYMVITSQGKIGIIINDSKCGEDNFNEFRRQWTLFYSYLNWSFYNEMDDQITSLNNLDLNQKEEENEEKVLFDKYISENLSKFGNEFNSRMEKYNVYFLQMKIKDSTTTTCRGRGL